MPILHFYVPSIVNGSEIERKVKKIFKLKEVDKVEAEYCFNVDVVDALSTSEKETLVWLLSDPMQREGRVTDTSQLQYDSVRQILVEIGPRLNFSTPFSSNAVAICRSIGLDKVKRVEKSTRYLLDVIFDQPDKRLLEHLQNAAIGVLQDRMTECTYAEPISTFDHGLKPQPWYEVEVLKYGADALREINVDLGLSLDDWDINFYTELFQKLGRNPTSVECFDLAQSNSEHSRHWFFKGKLVIDGSVVSSSLFKMIMETQETSNENNVIKFNDNSSAIKGFTVHKLRPATTTGPSTFHTPSTELHLIFTAETHNFPTAVSPFSGAATGTGGRIRDVQAVGRGGHPIAGTVGYAVGNLFIPGYDLPWEKENVADLSTFAKPLEILIEASNGCSDYGNKFGEPVICGFTRSFGLSTPDNQKIEYIKPILFSGGMGTVESSQAFKQGPAKGMKVVKIGGPVYRIGVGGGSASSAKIQGDNKAELDFDAVQRGDAEMEQKLNRLIRGCVEFEDERNPILSIHDQGAGGNGNVLKELVEPAGAVIFAKAFELGDESISTLELWGAEYQENNAILCHKGDVAALTAVAHRERCPANVVGTVTDNGKVILTTEEIDHEKFLTSDVGGTQYPVNLDLQLVLGNVPQKQFNLVSSPTVLQPLLLPRRFSIPDTLSMVLRHPTVCSKRFLTNKVDRSVTGLIAQQQCVGPWHTPVADVAVTAISYFENCGIASSIGEQPIKGLLNSAAGARMSVAEALSNLVFARISSLRDVKCSGNWMWPAKLHGEGVHLYDACVAMCSIMKKLGIAIDGGKDSLSMATRLRNDEIVKSPGTLVISTYAPCPDIRKKVTPDLKAPWYGINGCLLHVDISGGKTRLGGSIVSQCYGQLGQVVPDIESPKTLKAAFDITQELIGENKILSGHDISDGGLVTCLAEMAIAGLCGIKIKLSNESSTYQSTTEVLFAEECGWILECAKEDTDSIIRRYKDAGVLCLIVGTTESTGMDAKVQFFHGKKEVINLKLFELCTMWEESSYQIEKLQTNSNCAELEYQSIRKRKPPPYKKSMSLSLQSMPEDKNCKVVVLREEGLNGDREMVAALHMSGFEVWDVTMQDLLDNTITLDRFRGIVFPGGFSFADVLGAAKGWAATILYHEKVYKQFKQFFGRNDTFSFGVCNGCQLMCLIKWIGGPNCEESDHPQIMLKENMSGRFESRFTTVEICPSPAIMLQNMQDWTLGVWIAHGEGRFTYSSKEVEAYLEKNNCIAIRYVDDVNKATEKYPFNPNGSPGGVAGICSPDGRHLAMMPHPERCVKFWQWPYIPAEWKMRPNTANSDDFSPWFQIFLNAYKWCQGSVSGDSHFG